jgi:hypothetical protein
LGGGRGFWPVPILPLLRKGPLTESCPIRASNSTAVVRAVIPEPREIVPPQTVSESEPSERYVRVSDLLSRLQECRLRLEEVVDLGCDTAPQLAMLLRVHKIVHELAQAPARMTSRELAQAQGCSQRTAQRQLKDGFRGPTYDRQKAMAGARGGARKAMRGGIAR